MFNRSGYYISKLQTRTVFGVEIDNYSAKKTSDVQ